MNAAAPDAISAPRSSAAPLSVLLVTGGLALAFVAVHSPGLALILVGALVFVAIAVARVDLALLVLIGTAPLDGAWAIDSESFITVSKLAGAVTFTAFAIHALAKKRRLVFDRTHALVLLILGIAMISTIQARDLSLAGLTTLRYASFVALYVVATQFIGDRRLLQRIAWALSCGAVFAALLALDNYFTGARTVATLRYADPNDLAFMLATALPITFWLLRTKSIPARVALFGMIGIISTAIFLTFSRGALVALGAACLWIMVVERRHVPVVLLGIVIAALVAVPIVQSDPERFDLSFQMKAAVAEENKENRLDAWIAAGDLMVERPLVGVGPGNFRLHYVEAAGRPVGSLGITVVHNTYLDIGAELGVIAMVAFLAYLAIVMVRLAEARREGRGPPGFAEAVRTSLLVAVVAGLTLSQQYYMPFWLLGALATVMWAEGRRAPEPR